MDSISGGVAAVTDKVTPFVIVGSVVATVLIYLRAAFAAYSGDVPGPYVALLYLAPFGLMASYIPLIASVIMTIVPSVTALALMGISAASVMAFQSAVVAGDLRVVMALAALNLVLYISAAYAQMGLSVAGAQQTYARRQKLARVLSEAAKDAAEDRAR
jgi:hypothetical protein